jgi:hypothetical protein
MTDNNTGSNPEIVSDYYENYTQTQREIMVIETRKTRNNLFTIAAIVFAGDLLVLLAMPDKTYFLAGLLIILIVPGIITALAFLAIKEPIIAMIVTAFIIGGIWTYTIIATGGKAAIMGWLVKAVIIYFIISGFRHAAEANRIKKELNT